MTLSREHLTPAALDAMCALHGPEGEAEEGPTWREMSEAAAFAVLPIVEYAARRETLEDVASFIENSAPASQDAISDAIALSCASLAASIRAFTKAGGK